MDREQFRIDRVAKMDTIAENLMPEVQDAIESGDNEALLAAVAEEFTAVFANQPGFAIADSPAEAWNWFKKRILPGIEAIKPTSVAETVAGWLGTAIVNGARVAAAEGSSKVWISRKDDKVRPFHVEADGQTVLWSDPFTVCGDIEVMFPAEPVGDPSCWINCRCVAGPASMVSSSEEVVEMADSTMLEELENPADEGLLEDNFEDDGFEEDDEFEDDGSFDTEMLGSDLKWHGVLAPEMVRSGDGRMFSEGALSWRDLPLPLRWQEADTGGHDGAVTIATIDRIERRGNLLVAEGTFSDIDMADRAVGMIGEGSLKGVSIDADSAELAEGSDEGQVEFSKGRISAATLVAIPAFAEAYIAIGPLPPAEVEEDMVTSDTTLADDTDDEFSSRKRRLPKPPSKTVQKGGKGRGASNYVRPKPKPVPMPKRYRVPSKSYIRAAEDDLAGRVANLTAFMAGAEEEFGSLRRIIPKPKPKKVIQKGGGRSKGVGSYVKPPKRTKMPKSGTGPYNPPRVLPRYLRSSEETVELAVSDKPWDGSASRFSPEEWRRSCVLHKCDGDEKSCHGLPIKEPSGALSRAGVHAAASRFNQVDAPPAAKASAKRALRGAYKQLGEKAPDALTASAEDEEFARGPGWVTNPKETRRLHAYWTKPGHKGFAKVRWGQPGDFTRLRRFLSKYIPANLLNRVTAQWHKDAVGYWPGEAGRPGNPAVGERRGRFDGESVNLTAAVLEPVPANYFSNPELPGPTGLIVEGDRVFGHIASWSTCHIGIKNMCTTPPRSQHDYAYFRTGAVLTDQGRISVGQITMGTGHASLQDGSRQAASHYDNTGTVVADVVAGEDDHGIWISGRIRDGVTSAQVHALQAGAISGDWRAVGGNLELIAALVVNVPGFPVPRPALAADAGEQISLVAAGVIDEYEDLPDVKSLTDLVVEEMGRREQLQTRMKSSQQIINAERVAALRASVIG